MMRRYGWCLLIVLLVSGSSGAAYGTDGKPEHVFGFGGPMAAVAFPDLAAVNLFLGESGQDPLSAPLVGGGGSGRGGAIGGLSLGGMGFGVLGISGSPAASEGATLVIGGGGFDLGYALRGDDRSVLTAGVILGGGATVLTLSTPAVEPAASGPQGIVIEPVTRVLGRGFAFLQPYVSLEAQLLGWLGLEVRFGYLVPVFGADFGDLVGIPAPSLDLSGPFVGVSLLFGGVSTQGDADGGASEATGGSIDLGSTSRLVIENRSGDLVIASYPVDVTQTGTQRRVDWVALRKTTGVPSLGSRNVVEVTERPDAVALKTAGRGKVDYFVKVPSGTDLLIKQGAGTVTVTSHAAGSLTVALGTGDVKLDRVTAAEISIEVGVGSVTLRETQATALMAHVGTGEIDAVLARETSATIAATAGLGEVDVSGFPGMTLFRQGIIGKTASAVLGGGVSKLTLAVGIGSVEVRPLLP